MGAKKPVGILTLAETSAEQWRWLRDAFYSPGDLRYKIVHRRQELIRAGKPLPCYLLLDESFYPEELEGWRLPNSPEVIEFEKSVREACAALDMDQVRADLPSVNKRDGSTVRQVRIVIVVGTLIVFAFTAALLAYKIHMHELGYSWRYSGPCWNYLFNRSC